MSDVTMPQLGETVTEGTITKWFKQVGDRVEQDELLFEVSTDKVDSEVSSPASGFLAEIRVPEGDTVDVGVVLAVITAEAGASAPLQAPADPAPVAPQAPVVEAAPPVNEPAPVLTPVAPAPVLIADPAPAGPPTEAPAPVAASGSGTGSASGMDKVLSPVVRKLINENNLDPGAIIGTGVGGRITREDVLDFIDSAAATSPAPVAPAGTAAVAPAAVAPPAAPIPTQVATAPTVPEKAAIPTAATAAPAPVQPAPAVVVVAPAPSLPVVAASSPPAIRLGGRDELMPFNNVRRRTGEHMLMSLSTAPHAFIAVEVDFTAVDRVRNAKREGFKADEGFSLTYMPFIARAVVDAMRNYPNVNASVSESSLVVHHAVALGIAVDLDFNGLMVPVVRDADGKRMRAIARDIADLASRARTKKLTPDDITGGTFTLSNAGPYGIDLMQSIINQPQVGILSITSVKKKPVVVELPDGSETIAIRPQGMLGLSWDHRAFDGAYAASFLHEVQTILETRDWNTEL